MRPRLLVGVLSCVCLSAPLSGAVALTDGRAHYDAGRYDDAAAAFSALASQEPRNSAARYALGNSLFKAGRLGPAIASYERAFELDPRDSDIRFNLAFALRRAGEDFVPPGIPPGLFWIFTALSERELAGLHWLAAWLTLGLGAGMLLAGKRDERQEAWLMALGAAWLVCGVWWVSLRAALPPSRGVVMSSHAELRHGPGLNFGAAFTIPEGRRVRILGSTGPWLEVGVLKEGARGWIEAGSIERL